MGRADRLKEVYEYVRTQFPIHTQSDFAEWLKYNRTYISSAMHGNEKNLTDKLFTNICEAFPGVFNLDYLLTGKGDLLTVEEDVKVAELSQMPMQQSSAGIDISSIMDAAIAAQKQTIESQKQTIESLKRESASKDDLIQSLRDQLADKDHLIAEQKARLIDYRHIIDSHDSLPDYPFSIGTAEGSHREQKNL